MSPSERVQLLPPPVEVVAGNLERVRARIAACGRDPDGVTVVAVTKGFTADAVQCALAAGLYDIGENYVDELLSKAGAVCEPAGFGEPPGEPTAPGGTVRWHYLGAIQRRRVKQLAPVVGCWQTVSRFVEAEAIFGLAPRAAVMVEVEATGLAGRNGCAPHETGALVEAVRSLGLDVRGLMTVGPPGMPELSREVFRTTAALAGDLGLAELSMGMSDDLEIALAEGTTMVRVGRALFGERDLPLAEGADGLCIDLERVPLLRSPRSTLCRGRRVMPGFFKRAMVYLGLVDDEYEDYEEYEPRGVPVQRASHRASEPELEEEPVAAVPMATSTIRPMVREESMTQVPTITPRAVVRPVVAEPSARVHVIAPTQFGDARQIADRLMSSQPVIVNLQLANRELMRRMIDFCSGAAYTLGGKMERVADKVFLVTPSNVQVSAEERQRLQENGLLRP